MIGPLLALFAALQTPAAQQPGEVRIFGDWAVGCDNGWACEALSLSSEDWSIGDEASLTVRRAGGEHGYLSVGARVFEDAPGGILALHIDGDHVATLTDSGDGQRYEADPGMARLILPLIAHGRSASLHGPTGALIGEISLAGSAAALRFIDDRQERAGTRGAAVARGSHADSAVPEPPAIPVYPTPAPSETNPDAAPLSLAQAQALPIEECDAISEDVIPNRAFPLPGGGDLILISCSRGAYNFSDVAFIRRGTGLAPARFDRVFAWGDALDMPLLVNTNWDASDGTLSTYAKGRGLGDCGTSERFAWDGTMFRLIERREMNECRGSPNWITVWRASAVRAP